jgi:Protein of unknown function (DUF3619)
MIIPSQKNDLADDIKRQLDTEADHLDPSITHRLDAARRQALASATEQENPTGWWKMAYAPALAAGLAIAVFMGVINNTADTTQPEMAANPLQSDFEVVLTNEDFELMEEDLEFYLWLEEEAKT